MGFTQLGIVRPSKLAGPDHPMAIKMAVKSGDVLEQAQVYDNLDEAIVGSDIVVGSTARSGVSGIIAPGPFAEHCPAWVEAGKKLTFLFGNEKSGLSSEELALCDFIIRIPIAAPQPSLNLAQAVQILAYELFARSLLAERTSKTK